MPAETVEAWRARQTPEGRTAIDRLRALVRAAVPEADESIKWNAPSFAIGGADRVTLGVGPRAGYRLVLHRGAAKDDGSAAVFDDPDHLAQWPSPDRGVVVFTDPAEIEMRAEPLERLIRRWCDS